MKSSNVINGNKIRRFSTARLIEHWLAMIAFMTLAATGLSQKFNSLDLSQWFILYLGGIDSARLIHRCIGIAFTAIIIIHIIAAIIGVVFRKWQPSMIINKKDFTDAVHNIRYYIGLESFPARCDRYDYKQKFEYWGVLVSGILMAITGFILLYASFVTRFLPGQIIPVAKNLHTNQGFLIFLIIPLWHSYNSILSPEVFPIDTVMFTGKISRERMMNEHIIEYERLFEVSTERLDEEEKNILRNEKNDLTDNMGNFEQNTP